MGRGSSEECLKWGGGGWGSLMDLFKNILQQGVGKGKSCSQGGGLRVSPLLLSPENFNHTLDTKITFYDQKCFFLNQNYTPTYLSHFYLKEKFLCMIS